MLELKACPRCKGDVYRISDHFGEYRQCLQCGHVGYVQPTEDPYAAILTKVKRKAAA